MNILVLSDIEWSDDNAFGNTVSNWFLGTNAKFYSIYRRTSMPNNSVCKHYYRITLKDCIKNVFCPEKIGNSFVFEPDNKEKATKKQGLEKKLINIIHKFNIPFVHSFEDYILSHSKWNNGKFVDFLKQTNPDIIFSFIIAPKAGTVLLERVKQHCPDCKVISHIADDVYGVASKKGKKEIRRQIELSDKLFGASVEICEAYKKEFGKEVTPLYKGCKFENDILQKNNNPIKLVYAGNLYYGRAESLAFLAKAVDKHNKISDKKMFLEIYTATEVKQNVWTSLNIDGASKICGSRPYSEIKEILSNADAVLHVESFDEKQKQVVKHSFSTKIIDCLQSGSVLVAIGPKDISSVLYSSNIPGAFVATNSQQISNIPAQLLNSDLYNMALKTRAYAKENHDIDIVQANLMRTFETILSK